MTWGQKLISNFGLGSLLGKVAADCSHKWIYREHSDPGIDLFSAWQNSEDLVSSTYANMIFHYNFPLIESHCCLPVFFDLLFAASKDMEGSVSVWNKGRLQ